MNQEQSQVVITSRPQTSPAAPGLTTPYIFFGPFHVDLQRQQLYRKGVRIKLPRRTLLVLIALLERPHEVVTREDIRRKLWPNSPAIRYEANVNTTVNRLRHFLDDSFDQPAYIQTIPREGYSFIATLRYSDKPAPISVPSSNETKLPELPAHSGLSLDFRYLNASLVTVFVGTLFLAGVLLGVNVAADLSSKPLAQIHAWAALCLLVLSIVTLSVLYKVKGHTVSHEMSVVDDPKRA